MKIITDINNWFRNPRHGAAQIILRLPGEDEKVIDVVVREVNFEHHPDVPPMPDRYFHNVWSQGRRSISFELRGTVTEPITVADKTEGQLFKEWFKSQVDS